MIQHLINFELTVPSAFCTENADKTKQKKINKRSAYIIIIVNTAPFIYSVRPYRYHTPQTSVLNRHTII